MKILRLTWISGFAAMMFAVMAPKAGAQTTTDYGSTHPSGQTPGVHTDSCVPNGCQPSCVNVPTGPAIIPDSPGPGNNPGEAIVVYNGCPQKGPTYHVTHYRYKYYIIKNVPIPYDDIQFDGVKELCKVCRADAPCPQCVAAGGYGMGKHEGEVGSEAEIQAMNQRSSQPQAPSPSAQPNPANTAVQPSTPVNPQAAAPAPVNQEWWWVWQPEGFWVKGHWRDGHWEIDPNSRTTTNPNQTAMVTNNLR